MKIVDMTEEHLRMIKVREMELIDLGDNFIKEHGELYFSSQYKKTVFSESGEVVMCLGGKVTDGMAHVWILASAEIYKNPVASLETIIELEKEAIEMHKVKLLYTYNNPDFPVAIRFLERIGYKQKWVCDGFHDKKERILLVKEA